MCVLVRCTLFALHCSYFADDSMLLASPFLLFAVGYWLFASRCSVYVSSCLVLVSRYSPSCCSLRIAYRTLLVITYYSRPNYRFSLLLSSRPQMAELPRGWFISARVVLFVSHRVNLLLTDACRSLQWACDSHHSTLIASHTLFLVARRSLLEICCFLFADHFVLLSSCISLLFVSCSVIDFFLLG